MQDGSNPKQLIAEKIKQSANILVTVGANPSVDALTAALGLTLMLNKLEKHATAVFSGVVPPAISFLEPNKTFENNVDSLRDFIIALDKDKADRLRYKVEDDVVRIFITPYRTKISEKDLQFSQGDFNVDLIVALGVEDQKDLDQAITAHGRILHDATVATINAAGQKSSLGSIDWQDAKASSLSEMLASLAESLKPGILDQQISTALLTGIVASTERFSNQHTTPHVMTMAAQLMAAGANQQLIATKLQTIPAPVSPRRAKPQTTSNNQKLRSEQQEGADGEMHIQHNEPSATPISEPTARTQASAVPAEPEPELPVTPPAAQQFNDLKQAIQEETTRSKPQRELLEEPAAPGSQNINGDEAEEKTPEPEEGYLTTRPSWQGRDIQPPTMGGTLSATAEQALEDKLRDEAEEKRNHAILTHDGPAQRPPRRPKPPKKHKSAAPAPVEQPPEPVSAQSVPEAPEPTPPPVEPIPAPQPTPAPSEAPPLVVSEPVGPPPPPAPELPQLPDQPPAAPAPAEPPAPSTAVPEPVTPAVQPATSEPTLEELEREAAAHAEQAGSLQTLNELDAARHQADTTASSNTLAAAQAPPASPVPPSVPAGLPPPPPMPDFGSLPPVPGTPPPAPELPQLPDQPPAAPAQPEAPSTPPPPATPADPGQFRIPGQ